MPQDQITITDTANNSITISDIGDGALSLSQDCGEYGHQVVTLTTAQTFRLKQMLIDISDKP